MADQPVAIPHESTLGRSYVGLGGIVVITLYLVFASLFDFYVMVKIWPPDPLPRITSSTVPGVAGNNATSTTQETEKAPVVWTVNFIWCDNQNPKTACWISLSTSLFLIAILSGALGSLLHSLRSLYWYAGNRKLVWSWAIMYMLLPFSGSVLATIFYIIIRAGFLPSSGTTPTVPNTPYGFAALGALVGLFSEEAVLKLKQVAETVFARTPPGKDHVAPPPKVALISPNSGPAAGGTPVTITGADFTAGAKVNIGGTPVVSIASVSTTSISATTPAHVAGPADVEVVNPDDQKGVLTGGFTYV
jgi:IPT/TIG domain